MFASSFDQLKVAVSNLKRQAHKKSEGSLAYVKGGLSTFFEAQDALSGKGTPTQGAICGQGRNPSPPRPGVYGV